MSPICYICLLNLWSAAPATLSLLLLWTSSTSSTCAVFGGSCRRLHDLFLSSDFCLFLQSPCCRQRIHCECLARSLFACGDHCPFCTQDLVPVLSAPLLAASSEHLNIPIDFNAPPANSSLNSLCVPAGMPHPPPVFPLCCAHNCGPPDFEPMDDRRMEWSPIHPSAQGSSSAWVLQWVCRSCGSSTSAGHPCSSHILSSVFFLCCNRV